MALAAAGVAIAIAAGLATSADAQERVRWKMQSAFCEHAVAPRHRRASA